ncbi:hypothetical protein BJY04DRAFT_224545 [Aspergillus karnatakaensis]|uniref:fungal specific transcription factor domain-containing protein n=1 Tax=Aspergillus karnatakaensis TaxID=1810916 RepID=UPI003CCE0CB7
MACEAVLSVSDLLVSRDIITLQAFVLYLLSRRAHDKHMAVWNLIAVAVRSARFLGLHQGVGGPNTQDQSFFNQQTQSRLWLTICLIDLQSSAGQQYEPLITYREAAAALTFVQHIDDSDFDPSTTNSVPDREGVTDTTFTLINYQVELAGIRLNLPSLHPTGVWTSAGDRAAVYSDKPHDQPIPEASVRLFEQASLRLLHLCIPDTSEYAWFTYHSIKGLVAAVCVKALSTNERRGKLELLYQALTHLKNTQIIRDDARSAGYRWYLNMPWSTLTIAIIECSRCEDMALVYRAWPLVEEWYQIYEHSGNRVISPEVVILMQRMQATFQATFQARHHSGQQAGGRHTSRTPSEHTVPDPTPVVLSATGMGFKEVTGSWTEADFAWTGSEDVFLAQTSIG